MLIDPQTIRDHIIDPFICQAYSGVRALSQGTTRNLRILITGMMGECASVANIFNERMKSESLGERMSILRLSSGCVSPPYLVLLWYLWANCRVRGTAASRGAAVFVDQLKAGTRASDDLPPAIKAGMVLGLDPVVKSRSVVLHDRAAALESKIRGKIWGVTIATVLPDFNAFRQCVTEIITERGFSGTPGQNARKDNLTIHLVANLLDFCWALKVPGVKEEVKGLVEYALRDTHDQFSLDPKYVDLEVPHRLCAQKETTLEALYFLEDCGFSLEEPSKVDGLFPFHCTLLQGNAQAFQAFFWINSVKVLLAKKTATLDTFLHLAFRQGPTNLSRSPGLIAPVETFIQSAQCHPDALNALNSDGDTAVDLALAMGNEGERWVKLLRSAGAKGSPRRKEVSLPLGLPAWLHVGC